MAVKTKEVLANDCTCDKCKHRWLSFSAGLPAHCPACNSREWNGKKKVGRPPSRTIKSREGLAKPTKVRAV